MRDGKLLAAWTQLINLSHGLTSPFDPARLRLMTIPQKHRKSAKRSLYEVIQGLIGMEIQQGRIRNRQDVME